ncbi:phage terminase large subunit family protein [Methylobacterium sp. E-066]|uniref:phage terminase large subunit family protein n=1 Tax=Methylobacterium sp. E-066 TaxID=2836584 RepID=UPI001FB9B5CD|nr:terminase gpA endonuclease subunit [Methylobacterium sp. E-066]MCJ2143726.1 phage terminase large subunit family protein [Methylobacterium sp. E-066]
MTVLANAERAAWDAIAAALRPPAKVDYLAWAVNNIEFSKRESQEVGRYNPDRFSYFNEILGALSPADPCRIVTLAKSAQLGGTVLANVFTGGTMDMDPCDFMYVHPTDNNAERWSKMKLTPMLRGTTSLRSIFPEKSREGGNSVLYKERADGLGSILISGANSPASLSQVTIPRQVQDDLAKWEVNSAGDPEVQADSRSRGVTFAKIFKISTPLVMPGCRITKNYEAGSQERLFVPCPHCGHMQTLEWENMLPHLDEEHPDRAFFICTAPDCGAAIEEHHRAQMLAGHEWRAANPKMKRIHRSFYVWSAYSFLQSWAQIAFEWFRAKGDPEAERVFLNDTVGQAFRAQSEAPPWEGLRDRAAASDYVCGTIPKGGLLVTLGIDCQDDRVEWQALAFGRGGRRWVIQYGVTPGHISEPGTRRLLDELLQQTWPNAVGRQVGIDLAAIDGNAWTEDVWGWAGTHPATRVIMVRGANRDASPVLEQVRKERNAAGKPLKYSKRFFNFGSSVLKMALYRNLAKIDPVEPGFVHLPRGLEDVYFQQLTAERREAVKRFGFVVYRWVKDAGQANEALDTHLQAETAANRLGLRGMPDRRWDKLEAERECPLPAVPAPIAAAESPATVPAPVPISAPQGPTSSTVRPRFGGIAALANALNRSG